MNLEDVLVAFNNSISSDQGLIMAASEQIMRFQRAYNEFLPIALQVSCDLSITVENSVRLATAVQFMRCLDNNINVLSQNELTYLLTTIVPATAGVAILNDARITNPLIDSFKLCFEQYVHKASMYGMEAGQLFESIFGSIFQAVDNQNVTKTEVALRCFVIYSRLLYQEIYSGPRDQACNYFYLNCLKNLIQYLVSLEDKVCSFASPSFINQAIQSVFALLDPRPLKDIFTNPDYADIPDIISQLLNNFGLASQSIQLQDAKEYACQILMKYISRARYVNSKISRIPDCNQFLEQWEQKQVYIAEIIVRELDLCPNFNLFQDHKSLESVFMVAGSLLEQQYSGQFVHPYASDYIMKNAQKIVNSVFGMIINAANVRMDRFENDDLLVIDCLKPSIDLVRLICIIDSNINSGLEQLAIESMNDFLSNKLSNEDFQDQEKQAKIFVGVLLIRRGLPNAPVSHKVKICLRSLEKQQLLHPIVFEEAAKLLISVCIDDYDNYNTFQYIQGATFDQAWQISEDSTQDSVPYIIDIMCQIYVSDSPGLFQCRMLSGILSRPVRQGFLPNLRICDLLAKSILIMLKTEDKAQSGGMVTFTKIALQYVPADVSNTFLSQFLSSQTEFQQLPQLIQKGAQFRGLIENAFNILSLCIDSLPDIYSSFETTVVDLCESILSVDFELAQSVFNVLDLFYGKHFVPDTVQPNLFDNCLKGFSQIFNMETFSESICYIYHVIPRHVELINQNSLEESSIYQLGVRLLQDEQLIAKGFGFMLLGSLLDKYVSRFSQSKIDKILPQFIQIFSQFFTDLTIFNTTQEIDPESKRYILFSLSYFFFIVTGICESNNLYIEQIKAVLSSESGQISLASMAFVASWSIHDDQYRPSQSFRFTLVSYVCLSVETLLSLSLPQTRLVTWPCLLCARYAVRCQLDYSAPKVPEITFSLLQLTNLPMNQFSQIFSNVNSVSIVFAQIVDQKDLPFWNRTDSTLFAKLARKVGINQEERSQYGSINVGARNLAKNIGTALDRMDTWQNLPQEFVIFIQSEINQIRSGQEGIMGDFLEQFGQI
ncbi:hypothetical protein SS50377_20939 [Spironucleus salmonicida]|uniref:Uncharacterized protein n=1 Tax=Spironucleus salmonicida TaxID=348837 RepID=V6LGF9_9EUKA|nr:hypothetical protein SS50377_20939 [Spironucleus salmonicida]|eukprot:EST43612.1 hypothetical protein SS50377_16654 [Spironucleus salmonicida]